MDFLRVVAVVGTVLVDTPERPPDWVNEDCSRDGSVFDGRDRDEPHEVERDADALVSETADELIGSAIGNRRRIRPR